MAEVTVECHAGYRGDETPRRFHLGGRTIEISDVLSRWREPGALFFRIRSDEGHIYVLRRDEQAGGWEIPEAAGGWKAEVLRCCAPREILRPERLLRSAPLR